MQRKICRCNTRKDECFHFLQIIYAWWRCGCGCRWMDCVAASHAAPNDFRIQGHLRLINDYSIVFKLSFNIQYSPGVKGQRYSRGQDHFLSLKLSLRIVCECCEGWTIYMYTVFFTVPNCSQTSIIKTTWHNHLETPCMRRRADFQCRVLRQGNESSKEMQAGNPKPMGQR